MTVTSLNQARPKQPLSGHVDVLIVGAGISGIGMGHYLVNNLPGKTFAIVDGRDTIGGTWDLFKYPGIRSDSDLHTFGYEFKPWTSDNAIADAHGGGATRPTCTRQSYSVREQHTSPVTTSPAGPVASNRAPRSGAQLGAQPRTWISS